MDLILATAILAGISLLILVILLLRKPGAVFADRVRAELDRVTAAVRDDLREGREESANGARQLREEISENVRAMGASLNDSSERGEKRLVEMRATLDERLASTAEAQRVADAATRQELQAALKNFSELFTGQLQDLSRTLKQQLSDLTASNESRLEAMRTTVETKLTQVQSDNEAKLERIRATVDEKLHATLEQRLGESFKLVSERLEQVHSGLGEMKTLAVGVGDLKKVLTNIKTRGTWGEVQLGTLLEQMLTPEQFARNVAPSPASSERVEFAVKLPAGVWLPIDSKFPQEEFQRLGDAQERGDLAGIEAASQALEAQVKFEARKIRDKYLQPPHTTDFGIMFLPTEGLFAEVLRRPGLCESIQRDFRVSISGPTTLAAVLSSLQMGFRTLAIEKRSSEVWNVLGAVKTEFGKFGDALEKVKKKLSEASNSIEAAETRHRVVTGKLRKAEELPAAETAQLLGLEAITEADAPAEKAD